MPERSRASFIALLLVATLAGCGGAEDGTATAGGGEGGGANVGLAEAQSYLEHAPQDLVRQALGEGQAPLAEELEPRPAASRRLEAINSREFDLLVYPTPALAREAWSSVLETSVIEEGGTAMRAVNLIAVFPSPADDDVYAAIKRALRKLATACRGEDGDPELRELCFGEDGEPVPPPGGGTSSDESGPPEAPVVVDRVRYRVIVSRQLNPRIAPDQALVGSRRPADGSLLFGVVVEACNTSERPARTTGQLALVSAFGAQATPVDLPDSNRFAYRAQRLEAEECLPRPGSPADRTLGGRLVLFEIPRERLKKRPLGLQITSRDGAQRSTLRLDV